MAAGGSAWRRAQDARQREAKLREQMQAARSEARRWQAASEGERLVAARLLFLTEQGWRLLVDRRWPGTASANVDMLLVGPSGVYVVDVKNWRSEPEVAGDQLRAGGQNRDDELAKLTAVTRLAERVVGELGLSPVAVRPLMVFAGHRLNRRLGAVQLLGEQEAAPALLSEPTRLKAAAVRAIGDHLERAFPAYETVVVPATPMPAEPGQASVAAGADALFDVEDIREAELAAARQAPIEQWMTFLHPDQVALVRRNWAGPARISGPAGTGKTVVGLHRAAHLARRTAGRILYVTYANNLPRVQRTFLQTMAPAISDRVEFSSLHSWTQSYLREHGMPSHLHGDRARSAFSLAWLRAGRDGVLATIDATSHYWREEIDYVIKGRGITTFEQYAVLPRRRRRVTLRRNHREAVWALYEEYERLRTQRGVHDFNDILTLALGHLRTTQAAPPYAAVITDEIQDLTLTGLRLLHALAGDVPNGLLLIGDGQQAVYPGGFRVSEAGIDIRGDRGQVLRTNYRNAKEILEAALAVVQGDDFEDLDGQRSPGRRDIDPSYRAGQVIRSESRTLAEHDQALLTALRTHGHATPDDHAEAADTTGWGDCALLCSSWQHLHHYQRLLITAGIPVISLDQYEGRPVHAVKLGTYRRSKGLEFKQVYLPQYDDFLQTTDAERELAEEHAELARSQLFVAMTRARDRLWLGAVNASGTEISTS
ncbi:MULTISPECIES: nuclease-related domain-containing DEAD/DEAH box helicase [unclassified Kitasatospora]|uniref:nuclease-related domain-containing DEAD/DEAH box helicase n=1 Tax=unclassified Kitasatospora TaxID=2633591 RepID=UPI002474E402|nr:UvrD-helicase domain-containing protein [Kitasatospora sp. GAS204B]